jgi:hypothetical protein
MYRNSLSLAHGEMCRHQVSVSANAKRSARQRLCAFISMGRMAKDLKELRFHAVLDAVIRKQRLRPAQLYLTVLTDLLAKRRG